jgi:hypothetical protein
MHEIPILNMGMGADPPSKSNVIRLEGIVALESQIRVIARGRVNVAFKEHAEEREEERGIHSREVLDILEHGTIVETKPGRLKGETSIKMHGSYLARDLAVILVLKEDKVFIITCYEI